MAKKKSSKSKEKAEEKSESAEKTEEETPKDSEEKPTEQTTEEKPKKAKKPTLKLSQREIKLFNRWSFDNLEVRDDSLRNYINLTPIIVPHSGGKHEHKRFWKTERVSICERFINKMLAPGLIKKRIKGRHAGLNAGKKQKALKIFENAFTMIEESTGSNPIQILIRAVENAAPREETTRISLGGISYQTAVDIAPQRRIDIAIKLLVQGAVAGTYNSVRTIDECIANELILAAKNNLSSRAIKRRDEIERIAISAR